jgi:hypothetical protein
MWSASSAVSCSSARTLCTFARRHARPDEPALERGLFLPDHIHPPTQTASPPPPTHSARHVARSHPPPCHAHCAPRHRRSRAHGSLVRRSHPWRSECRSAEKGFLHAPFVPVEQSCVTGDSPAQSWLARTCSLRGLCAALGLRQQCLHEYDSLAYSEQPFSPASCLSLCATMGLLSSPALAPHASAGREAFVLRAAVLAALTPARARSTGVGTSPRTHVLPALLHCIL